MDPISETLVGLDALAKLVVCTIGLFCVPILTRKYAQNLGLPAGQAIMSKAFLATNLAGLPALASAAKGATRSGLIASSTRAKEVSSAASKQALIGAEKLSRNFVNRLSGTTGQPVHSKLESFFAEQSLKKGLMKEAGVSPWTRKDESRLQQTKNPAELKALSSQKQAFLQFEKDWQKLSQHSPSKSSQPTRQESGGAITRQSVAALTQSPSTKSNRSVNTFQGFDGFKQKSFESHPTHGFDLSTNKGSQNAKIIRETQRQSREPTHNLSSSAGITRSGKMSTSDLYQRYQQIVNQRRKWKESRK